MKKRCLAQRWMPAATVNALLKNPSLMQYSGELRQFRFFVPRGNYWKLDSFFGKAWINFWVFHQFVANFHFFFGDSLWNPDEWIRIPPPVWVPGCFPTWPSPPLVLPKVTVTHPTDKDSVVVTVPGSASMKHVKEALAWKLSGFFELESCKLHSLKFNMEPEKWWLEDVFPIEIVPF